MRSNHRLDEEVEAMDEDNEDAMVVVRVGFRDTISQHLFDEESNDEEALDGCTEYGIDLDCIRSC